jgi:LacI family sucrose operon transcriptional repressor
MATLKDVALRAEVSTSTVTAILNDRPHCYASAATRLRVRQAAADVGYRPNRLARALVRGASGMFGLLTIDAYAQTFARAVNGIEDEATAVGCGLLLCHTHTLPERERRHMQLFSDSAVEGIIAVGPSTMERADEILAHRPANLPLVSINRQIDVPGVLSILMENRGTAREATEMLLEKGHRRIAYLDVPRAVGWVRLPLRSSVERREGYEEAMRAAGLESLVNELAQTDGQLTMRLAVARDAVTALLAQAAPPTAILAVTDLEALGALHACLLAGRRVPDDVALVGFDDLDLGRLAITPITSVRPSFYEAGRLAVQRLQNRAKEPLDGTIILPGTLLRRESTGDIPAESHD